MMIRQAAQGDLEDLLRLNQSEVPHVGDIDSARMSHLFDETAWFPVLEIDGAIAGFVIVMDHTANYDSLNFLWFKERYKRFCYVDRIVVSPDFRRRGVAGLLYDDCIRFGAAHDMPLLALEYNITPPNPVSAAFHKAYGFREVGRRRDGETSKEVAMQILDILPAG